MAKVFVIYHTKWGNTRTVAEKIAESLKSAGIESILGTVKDTDPGKFLEADAILVGAPNHVGRAPGSVKKFIHGLSKLKLNAKGIGFFDTYLGKDFEKAVKKMEKQASDALSGMKILAPGLSIRVDGMKGPITDGEIPKCEAFAKKIAAALQ